MEYLIHNFDTYGVFAQINVEPNHTMLAGHDYEHDIVMASKYV